MPPAYAVPGPYAHCYSTYAKVCQYKSSLGDSVSRARPRRQRCQSAPRSMLRQVGVHVSSRCTVRCDRCAVVGILPGGQRCL